MLNLFCFRNVIRIQRFALVPDKYIPSVVAMPFPSSSKQVSWKQSYSFHSKVFIIAACSSLFFSMPSVGATDRLLDSNAQYVTEEVDVDENARLGGITSWIYEITGYFRDSVSDLESKLYGELLSLNDQIGDGISQQGLGNIVDFLTSKLNSISTEPPELSSWDDFIKFIGFTPPSSSKEQTIDLDDVPPECDMTTPEIIRHNGYPCEEHTAETKDGYVLTMHRIPHGKLTLLKEPAFSPDENEDKPVVFIQHGLLADSSCWVSNGPENSLPFILADAGFDVWLGNVRGNSYSRTHTKLDASLQKEFWNFTWQDMAEFDLPAMVDYALTLTGQRQLHYIGHSQGTLIAFTKLSEDSEFQTKIKAFFALAPVATLSDITSSLRSLTPLGKLLQTGINVFGGAEILPKKPITRWIASKLHKLHKMHDNDALFPGGKLVYEGNNLLMYICGFRPESYFKEKMAVYFTHMPSGTSLHNIVHYSQLVKSGKTQKWDYGSPVKNFEHYGQQEPPEYDLTQVKAPVLLYAGTEDQLSDPKDVEKLSLKLNNVVKYCILNDFDHLDFLWGRRAPKTVYADIVETIKHFESNGEFKQETCDQLHEKDKDEL